MDRTRTLVEHIGQWARKKPDTHALVEATPDGSWDYTSWAEYWQTVGSVAKGLIALGLEPGDGVAIVGKNRRSWVFCQFGVMASGGILAPIYTTNTKEQVAYIVRHCRAKIAICDDRDQLEKYLSAFDEGLVSLQHIITMDQIETDRDIVISLDNLVHMGASSDEAELNRRINAVKDDDLAMLIYTSGTTGMPKGAEFTHRGIVRVGQGFIQQYPEIMEVSPFRYISYLPLCHAAEQALTNFLGLRMCSTVYFCPDITRIKDYLITARPHFFFGVPRVWEKFEAALQSRFAEIKGFKALLARWAMRTELKAFHHTIETKKEQRSLKRSLAHVLFVSKVKTSLGLDQLFVAASGAAPISRSTLEFFASLGIPIHEGYGMTETTGIATVQPLGWPRLGTVGHALPGVEIKIADDGEILLKGENMIRGYLHMHQETKELYTEGWLHTGDLGSLDEHGYLRITGRKKDLIITAGGKNVAPSEMENYLQSIPGIGQAVVIGDGKPYLCALLILDEEALPKLCQEAGIPVGALADVSAHPKVQTFLRECVHCHCNQRVARYQTIKKFEVLPTTFSVEGGELTPTMKVKRNVVNEKYADVIKGLYENKGED